MEELKPMSKRSFPLKDLLRRRFKTALTILSLTTSATATFFLLIFGDNIGLEVALLTGGKLTGGFLYTFSVILLIITLLNFLVGIVVASFFISLAMSERVRDVGVMKASGCLTDLVFGYFTTELSIIVFVSCTVGLVLGVLLSNVSINILNTFGFTISQRTLNIWLILPVFLTFVIVPHLIGSRAIIKALMVKPSEALSTNFSLGIPSKPKVSVPSKFGLTLQIAFKTLTRRRIATRQAIICLSLVSALTMVALTSGIITNQTTQNYVERAIQKNVVLVGHRNISRQYVDFLSRFFEARETEPINYSDSGFFIPQTLISRLGVIDGINKIDTRLILETRVYEIPKIIINPDEPNPYFPIGDHRSSEALVLGLEPENAINDWLILVGRDLNKTDVYSAMVGDSLATSIFTSPEKQSLKLLNNEFEITGVCQDPLNNGNVVYVPLKTLQSMRDQSECNLLFLQIDPSKLSQTIAHIKEEIAGTELEIIELDEILQRHLGFLNSIWSLVTLVPLSSLVTAALCLSGYMALIISAQRRDLAIMRAVGAKLQVVVKVVLMQVFTIVLISGAIGLGIGLLVVFFLLPEPIISLSIIFSIVLWLILALAFLGIPGLYLTIGTVKKSVIKAISEL